MATKGVNADTAASIGLAWGSDALLNAAIPLSRLYYDQLPGDKVFPYVMLEIDKHQEPVYPMARFSGWPYQDWRRVIFTGYDLSIPKVGSVLGLIYERLNPKLLSEYGKVLDWMFLGEETTIADGTTAGGETIYKGTSAYVMWSQRVIRRAVESGLTDPVLPGIAAQSDH